MPIGGVVAYRDHISPSGVGFDIGCGNLAVRTGLRHADVAPALPRVMDEIFSRISFGVGRSDGRAADHEVIDAIRAADFAPQRALAPLAAKQLGTVGAGNHYVTSSATTRTTASGSASTSAPAASATRRPPASSRSRKAWPSTAARTRAG